MTMNTVSRAAAFGLVATVVGTLTPAARAEPQFTWQVAPPESQGMSAERLDALKDELARRKTRAFLVVRNDKIVYEWYAAGNDQSKAQGTASLAKAIVGGLSLGVAVGDGRIAIDDPAAKYIPEWKNDPRKSGITIRHLGSHTSGVEDAEADGLPHDKLTGWKGEFWRQLDPPNDPFTIARDRARVLFDPGTKFQYSNPGIALLTYAVTASLRGAPENDVRTVLRDRVMHPIGVPDREWSVGYGKSFTVNDLPLVAAWGGAAITPRAAARIGRLVLREGDWDGHRILSREAVRQITGDAGLPGHCGMGWWTNAAGRSGSLPRDAVWGAGAGDQVLLVVPSLKLIVVRNGETLPSAAELDRLRPTDVFEKYHDPRAKILFDPIANALIAGRPEKPGQVDQGRRKPAPARPPEAEFAVRTEGRRVTVTCRSIPDWRAVIDRDRGGVITEFRLPADGPNLASDDGTRFEGLCNLIYAQFKEAGKDGAYVAKGALFSFGKVSTLSVVEKSSTRIVVEVEGTGGNQVEPKADVIHFRQRYTFLPDRVICDGDVRWVFAGPVPGSHPELIQLQCMFAAGAVDGEMRVWGTDVGPVMLPRTNSKGRNYPAGIEYPLTVEVPLKTGRSFHIHSLTVPAPFARARFYYNEFPDQIGGKRGFAFKAWAGRADNGTIRF